jgi:uncharacterized OsmC-like protein
MAQQDGAEATGGTGTGYREVSLTRTSLGHYTARNARGGEIRLAAGDDDSFTPVELLLAAIAGCSAVDVDHITSRRAEPEAFDVQVSGVKASTPESGNHMSDLEVTFTLRFPEGEDGDRARAALPRAVEQSRDRLCTVSRTVQLGTPITMRAADLPGTDG